MTVNETHEQGPTSIAPSKNDVPEANIATALSTGQKIRWPKGANAIRVSQPSGNKAIVLRGEEDPLKGTALDNNTVIEFGWVPNDGKGRPDRPRFKPLESDAPTKTGMANSGKMLLPVATNAGATVSPPLPVGAEPLPLEARLLPETMNGKKVYEVSAKSIVNFNSGFSHKLLCDGATFSTGSACAYRCKFCYVGPVMAKSPHLVAVLRLDPTAKHDEIIIRRRNPLEILRSQLVDRRGLPKFSDPTDTRVIYASPLVDVAANQELCDETVEVCKTIMSLTHWHIRLLSKSNLLPVVAKSLNTPDARRRIIFGVSTGTLDDKLARSFEATPLVSKRLASLHTLQDQGWRTFGMICPSLPQRDYTKFANEMAEAIHAEKCEHIWGEAMNVRGQSLIETAGALRASDYEWEANELERVAKDKTAWEQYARDTFLAHAKVYASSPGKLRYLQYVNRDTRDWWVARQGAGAIVL